MRIKLSQKLMDDPFVNKIRDLSNQNLTACYQCGKCSAGCPGVSQMDLLPNVIIRYAQLGLKKQLLESKSIWICASCFTCNTRCPKGINVAEVIEAIRQIVLRKHQDHLHIETLPDSEKTKLPPIAIISSMRKFTS